MPRRVRRRASRPCAPSALRQEQGRHPGRQHHRRPAHHQGRASPARAAGPARRQSRRVRDGRLRRHRQEREAAREHLRSSSPTISPRASSIPRPACRPKTAEEAEVVQSYGGEIIFTPGDIVYSSSSLINLAPPVRAAREAADRDGARRLHFRHAAANRSIAMVGRNGSMSSATPSSTATPTAR